MDVYRSDFSEMYQLVDGLITVKLCPLAWSSSSKIFILIQWLPSKGNTRMFPPSQCGVNEMRNKLRKESIPKTWWDVMAPIISERNNHLSDLINYIKYPQCKEKFYLLFSQICRAIHHLQALEYLHDPFNQIDTKIKGQCFRKFLTLGWEIQLLSSLPTERLFLKSSPVCLTLWIWSSNSRFRGSFTCKWVTCITNNFTIFLIFS